MALYALGTQQKAGITRAGNEKGEPMKVSASSGGASEKAGGGGRLKEL